MRASVPLLAALLLVCAATLTAARPPVPVSTAYPWFYLRGGVPIDAAERTVEIIFVGDTMFGRATAEDNAPPLRGTFQASAPWLATADLAFTNLESSLPSRQIQVANEDAAIRLRGEPGDAFLLAAAGFDLASVANNHRLDYGAAAAANTVTALRAAGVAPVAETAVHRYVDGVHLAFLAFDLVGSPEVAPATEETAIAAVAGVADEVDAVVVSVHWGYEYEPGPDPGQERLAQRLVAAGADLIVGHHPHVAQQVQIVNGSAVAFSLGNFLFDQSAAGTDEGLALRAFFDDRGLRGLQALPVRAGLNPRLLPPQTAFLARLAPPLPRHTFNCTASACGLTTGGMPAGASGGLFWSGSADLTGDGQDEQVRRVAEQITVYTAGQPVWSSPATWQVVDVALGDPNDDGRAEILLAVRKADPEGFWRSHPYIVGYRGGTYRLIWGGRAVSDPIREVELGDVDGDGKQELLVVAARADGNGHQVEVWRWHGWGFSLLWRSAPAAYQDLHLCPPGDAQCDFSIAVSLQTEGR